MGWYSDLWSKACSHLLLKDDGMIVCKISDEELLEQAHQDLVQAQNVFSRVEDPDMIDYAVLNLIAAEKRYNYLIKKIKNKQ
ncbi:MAG: DUF2508 family protein [Syntrophomonas sp.]